MKHLRNRARVLFALTVLGAAGASATIVTTGASHNVPSACRCMWVNTHP